MRIRQDKPFSAGYNAITDHQGEHSDMMMDFGILKLTPDQVYTDMHELERYFPDPVRAD
jgi:5-deoxy-glucuronate isomerase